MAFSDSCAIRPASAAARRASAASPVSVPIALVASS
jgi:hypothetical protein